jgi:ABC-type polysaccharide/polyol phosphate export permease
VFESLVFKAGWTVHCLVLPLAAVPWSALALGIGLLAAALFAFFRDLRPIVQMGLMLAFFSAPILFKPDLFATGSPQAALIAWHPLTYLAALFQKPIYAAAPSIRDWLVCSLIAVLAGAESPPRSPSRLLLLCLVVCSAASKTRSGRPCARGRPVAGGPAAALS